MKVTAVAVACCILAVATTAHAAVLNYVAFLDGAQETPPVATPGTGAATITLDDVALSYDLSGNFTGLVGLSTNAHIHGPAGFGEGPAGIVVGLTYDTGVNAGSFSGAGTLSQANFDLLVDGLTYINIHSNFAPGGEIRGQIVPIPEPATLGLLALAASPLVRRRR